MGATIVVLSLEEIDEFMKINVPDSVLNDHTLQCWQYVAEEVDRRMGACKTEAWNESFFALVRRTCGEVYASAMNGGDGRPVRATQGCYSVEVCMHTVGKWTVDIFGRIA